MARFVGAVFVIAVGPILYVGQGVETLDEQLVRAWAGQVEETKLDRVLSGSPSALQRPARALGHEIRDAFVSGARKGIVCGFSDVMWLIATVGIASVLLGYCLLRPDRPSVSR